MWMLMNNIQKEIDTGAVNRSPKYAGEICNALQDHNRQEEKQVYHGRLAAGFGVRCHFCIVQVSDIIAIGGSVDALIPYSLYFWRENRTRFDERHQTWLHAFNEDICGFNSIATFHLIHSARQN